MPVHPVAPLRSWPVQKLCRHGPHLLSASLGAAALATALATPSFWQAAPPCTRTVAATVRTSAPAQALAAPGSALDLLRQDGGFGHPFAAVDLVAALLDRYESGGPQVALFEAMLILEHHWDTPAMLHSGQIRRVVERHCPNDPLLRSAWLCEVNE